MGVALRRKKEPKLAKAVLKRALEIREANLSCASNAVNSSAPAASEATCRGDVPLAVQ